MRTSKLLSSVVAVTVATTALGGKPAFAAFNKMNRSTKQTIASAAAQGSNQLVQFRYVISEPCSLVDFVDILSNRNHATSWVKDWYEKQCKSDPLLNGQLEKDMQFLSAYRELMDRTTSQSAFADATGKRLSLNGKLIVLAAGCADLQELFGKLKGVVKEDDYQILERTLTHFDRPYRMLVWNPGLAAHKQRLADFQQGSVNAKMSERLATVQRFMNSPWISGTPFTVVLVPLPVPTDTKSTGGQSLGSVQVVELLPNSTFESKADVVFHEACHALWNLKPGRENFETEFDLPGKGKVPMTELYEGMATAIAEGWFTRAAFGKTSKSWYGDKIIDRYAHAVEPLYSSYLDSDRSIDTAFAKEATQIFHRTFPNAARQIQLTFGILVIAQEMPDLTGFKSDLEKAMPRMRDSNIAAPIDDPRSIEAWQKYEGNRVAVLLSSADLGKLQVLGISTAQINALKDQALSNIVFTSGSRKVLFCVAHTAKQQQRLLFEILRKNKWPPSRDNRIAK